MGALHLGGVATLHGLGRICVTAGRMVASSP